MAELETDEPPESMPVADFFRSSPASERVEPDEPPESIPAGEFFKGAETASRPGAFMRGAAEGVIPGAAGLGGGILSGAATGAGLGMLGANPFTVGAGALIGGVVGGLGVGYGASRLQEAGLEASGLREGEGFFSRRQKETDEALFPYSRFAGELAGGSLGLRPGGRMIERGIGAGIGTVVGGAMDYAERGEIDPVKALMGGVQGAAFPNINRMFGSAVSKAAPRSWRANIPGSAAHEFQSPEAQPPLPNISDTPPATMERASLADPYGALAEADARTAAIDQQIELAAKNRDVHRPGDLAGLHDQWSAYHDSLLERRRAIQSGMNDADITPQGRNPVTSSQQAKNNATPWGGPGESTVQAKVADTATGDQGHAAGSTHEAARPNDPARNYEKDAGTPAAAEGVPGAASTKVENLNATNVSSDIAMAMKGAARKVGPTAEEEAAATAQGRAQADAQPTPSGERLEREFPKVAQPGEQPKPFTERQLTPADAAQLAANEKRIAELEARLAQSQAPPEPAVTAPVTPPAAPRPARPAAAQAAIKGQPPPKPAAPAAERPEGARAAAEGRRPAAKRTDKTTDEIETEAESGRAATIAEMKAANARMTPEQIVDDYRSGGDGTYVGALKDLAKDLKGSKDPAMKAAHAIAKSKAAAEAKPVTEAVTTFKPYVAPDTRPPVVAEPTGANKAKPKLSLRRIAKDVEGSLDIGPDTRRPTAIDKDTALRDLSTPGRATGFKPKEIADTVLAAAEGDARYALTLMNRKMTEDRGWALKRNVIEARDILAEQAKDIPARAEPSPEVPVVPGKTAADLKPRKTELIPAKREYTPPGKRTPQKVIDPITGEPRDTMVLRKPSVEKKLMEDYTAEERGRVLEHLDTLPEAAQLEALKRLKQVPKETVLANLKELGSAEDIASQKRSHEKRTSVTGGIGKSLQHKAYTEGILAAHEKAYAANPRPAKEETQAEVVARAEKIVKDAQDEANRVVAELTRTNPKYAHVFTGNIGTVKNEPPASRILKEARALKYNPSANQRMKFDAEEILALDKPQAKQRKGGLTGDEPDVTVPETEVQAGPRYEARVDPDSPTFTSDHRDLVDMLNGLSERAHTMMEDAYGSSILDEVNKKNMKPGELKAELLGRLIDAQDKQNKYAHALPGETLVKTTSVRDRAGIAQVEQTGRFKPTKETDYRNLTKAEREKANTKVYGPDTEYYQQVAPEVLAHFGKQKETAARLARGEIGGDDTTKGLEASGRLLGKIPGPYEKKPRWMAKLLGDVVHDPNGALDVTKIFSWISKNEKKYRPEREPMVPTGMTRLYRAEPATHGPNKPPADWLAESPEYKGTVDATGRWFAPSREEAQWYVNHTREMGLPPIVKYVDVPTAVVEQYRVDNLSGVEGKKAREFSRRWDKEFFLPREIADQRVAFEPQDLSLTDHMRRLWGDENGAMDFGKIKDWLPNARSRARSEYDPTATEQTRNYANSIVAGDKFGERVVKLRTEAANLLRDNLYAGREAGVRPAAEVEAIGRAIVNRTESALTPAQRKWKEDHLDPLHKEYNERYIRVRDLATELGVKGAKEMPEPVDNGPGFVRHLPRREVRTAEDVEAYDPRFTNTNPLGIERPAVKERAWFALQEDGTKAREFYHLNDKGNMVVMKDGVAGQVYRPGNNPNNFPETFKPGQVGQRWGNKLVDNVTIDEIMRHGRGEPAVPGGDPVKLNYERNPMFVLGTANKDLIYAETRLKFLKELVNNPDFQQNVAATREVAEKKWGKNNIKQTILEGSPFHNKWFPKPMAFALDDLVKQGFNYSGNTALEKISRFNQSALKPFYFLGPAVHPLNELDKLIIGRGFDNLNVSKTLRNFKKGLDAVREQGNTMTEITEAGGNPMFLHALVSRFEQNYAKSLGVELAEKNWKYDPIFKKFGINTKAKYWEPAYQGSNKGMWWSTDVMYAMLYHDMKDRMGGGHKNWEKKSAELAKLNKIEKPTAEQVRQRDELTAWTKDLAHKSVVETEKIIDGYTIPSTFGRMFGLEGTDTGRLLQQTAADPLTANFGRYSYGLIKTLVNIGKNMAGKNENLSAGHSAALGFSQAATMVGMISIIYPLLSKAYAMTPWAKPESEFELRGASRVASLVPETVHKGIGDTWSKIAARALSPSVGLNLAATSFYNRDNVGRKIMESAGPGGWAAVPFQAAGHAFDQIISPAGQVSRAYAQEGLPFAGLRFAESNFGVRTPSDAQIKYEQKRPQTDKRQGDAREKHPRGVFDMLGNEARKLVRGYEKGGVVTATETEGDSTPGDFDPEGDDYDYQTATDAGMGPDENQHWSSREPKSGVILKGRSHPTFDKTIKGEEEAGYEIYKKGKRYHSREKGVIPTSKDE